MQSTGRVVFFSIIITVISFFYSLHAGQVTIETGEIFSWLMGSVSGISEQSSFILTTLRFPRSLATLLIGAALGGAGLCLQTILRNPLADPFTLGLSGGASLGAVTALALSLEPQSLWVPGLSVLGCVFAVMLVFILARKHLASESRSIVLFGVLVSLFFGALVVFGFSIISPQKLQTAMFWLLGEFGSTRDLWIKTLWPFLLLPLFIMIYHGDKLDSLALGEARAISLGVPLKQTKILIILICTLLTAMSVAIAGLVGFIGLVSPHVARRLTIDARHRTLMILSSFLGATLLTFADSLGRHIAQDFEIPAGSVAALMGAPLLMFLLVRERHARPE